MYVVKNEGSWFLFTKSNYLLNRALLNRGLGVLLAGQLLYIAQVAYTHIGTDWLVSLLKSMDELLGTFLCNSTSLQQQLVQQGMNVSPILFISIHICMQSQGVVFVVVVVLLFISQMVFLTFVMGDGLQCKQSDPPKKDKMDDVDTKVKQNLMFAHNIQQYTSLVVDLFTTLLNAKLIKIIF